jgi:hypothetical protein
MGSKAIFNTRRMKRTFLFSLFFFMHLALFSQGNLQFSQIKLVSTLETVPAGKVWKVESAVFMGGAPFCLGTGPNSNCAAGNLAGSGFVGDMAFQVNGQTNYLYTNLGQPGSSASYASPGYSPFPLWLPASSTLAAGTNMRYLSVIEFTIVP